MTVFITKYALTKGIIKCDQARLAGGGSVYARPHADCWETYFPKKHWHERYDEAVEHAEKMRIAKLASLKRQISKLEKLKFE